jgi:hypothetical protein
MELSSVVISVLRESGKVGNLLNNKDVLVLVGNIVKINMEV